MFLAALAPDLCAVAGAERDRYTGLAEAMGLPRVVRSIEILGQALIDMREAPDAQVVLEIALVRAVRPDLDSGMEALSERVAVLERSRRPGRRRFPGPGRAGCGCGAAAAAGARAPVAAGASPGARRRRSPRREVGKRPSLGALRRSKAGGQAAPRVVGTGAGAPAPAAPAETGAAVAEASDAAPATHRPRPSPAAAPARSIGTA